MELIKKLLVTFCLVVSSSCYHVVNTIGDDNDRISSVGAAKKRDVGPELLYMNDETIDIESSPAMEFYDTLTTSEDELKDDKSAKKKTTTTRAPAQSRTITFKYSDENDDDIFASNQFNEAFEKEMKRREQLLSRLQDQSRRIAKVQHEIFRVQKENNIVKKEVEEKKEDFWTALCRITKKIAKGFLRFFGIDF